MLRFLNTPAHALSFLEHLSYNSRHVLAMKKLGHSSYASEGPVLALTAVDWRLNQSGEMTMFVFLIAFRQVAWCSFEFGSNGTQSWARMTLHWRST